MKNENDYPIFSVHQQYFTLFKSTKNTGTFPDVYIVVKYFRMTLICCEKRMLNENLKKK